MNLTQMNITINIIKYIISTLLITYLHIDNYTYIIKKYIIFVIL